MNFKIEVSDKFKKHARHLLTIYDKSEQANISENEIKELLSFLQ